MYTIQINARTRILWSEFGHTEQDLQLLRASSDVTVDIHSNQVHSTTPAYVISVSFTLCVRLIEMDVANPSGRTIMIDRCNYSKYSDITTPQRHPRASAIRPIHLSKAKRTNCFTQGVTRIIGQLTDKHSRHLCYMSARSSRSHWTMGTFTNTHRHTQNTSRPHLDSGVFFARILSTQQVRDTIYLGTVWVTHGNDVNGITKSPLPMIYDASNRTYNRYTL